MRIEGKTVLAVSGALALASMGLAPLAAVAAPAADGNEASSAREVRTDQVAPVAQAPATVEGQFGYSQAVVTPVAQLSGVFAKSASVLCQSLPDYGCSQCASSLLMTAPGVPGVQATAQELAKDDGVSVTMACACATNAPGGGAAANAEAQGVLFKSLAAMMGV